MKRLRGTNNVKEIKIKGIWGQVRIKKLFPETITHKVTETNSTFHMK